ncbi:MAG: DMT family transporter [Deltaproteobacteria bacterium]|nr:DMT family transporter [Deltaproteobacteria bacterium]
MTDPLTNPKQISTRLANGLLLGAAALWGLTFTAGKVASLQASPLNATLWRFVLAGLILVPMAVKAAAGKPYFGLTLASLPSLALSGLTGLVLYNFFFIKALRLIPASRGSVIVCGSPALIYLGSVIFFGEKLKTVRVVGIALSLLGTAWAVSSGRPFDLWSTGPSRGDLIMLLCPLSWTVYSLLAKLVLKRNDPLSANAWSVVAAVAMMFVLVPVSGEPLGEVATYGPITWLCLVFLGLGGTALGFTFFYQGIVALGPHKAAAFINLVPIFGIFYGWLLLKETPGLSLFVGLAMILAGIRLIQKY